MEIFAPDNAEYASCPICGSNGQFLYYGCDQLHSLPGYFRVALCESCDVLYLQTRPLPEELATYYPDEYGAFTNAGPRCKITNVVRKLLLCCHYGYYPHIVRPNFIKNVLKALTGPLLPLLPHMIPPAPSGDDSKLLDVGCGAGSYLSLAKEAGWHTFGVEVDADAAAQAIRNGHNVIVGPIEDVDLRDEVFDLVTMSHVVEHVRDPVKALNKVARATKTDGWVWIRTPNNNSFLARLFKKNWFHLDVPRHLLIFSQVALADICRRAGLHIESVTKPQRPKCLVGTVMRGVHTLWGGLHPREVQCRGFVLPLLAVPLARIIEWLGGGDELLIKCRKLG